MSTKRVLGKPVKRIDEQWRRERRRASQYYCLSISHSDRTIFLLFMEPLFVSPTESKCTCLKTIHRHHGVLMSILEKRHEDWKDCSAGKHARYYCRALKFSSQHPIWLTHKILQVQLLATWFFFDCTYMHMSPHTGTDRNTQLKLIKLSLFSQLLKTDYFQIQYILISVSTHPSSSLSPLPSRSALLCSLIRNDQASKM